MTRYRQLKPRPGRSGEEVVQHQRGRLHAATIDLVAERGYPSLTVTGIARAAGVSTHTFYENFSDKDDCFLSTYDLIVRHTAREVLAARAREREWREQARAGFVAFAREIAGKPKAARLALIEAFASDAGLARMSHTNGLFETLVDESFDGSDGAKPPPLIVKAIVAGAIRIARARLLAGQEQRLADDADELMCWALSLPSDAATEVVAGATRGLAARPQPVALNGNGRLPANAGDEPDDERAMILTATTRLAVREGYAELTAPRIRAAAGVSKRRFQEYFDDVYDCFMAALQMRVEEVLERAKEAHLAAESWPRGIYRTLTTTCNGIADDPVLAKLAFVEIFVPGRETIRWRDDLMARQTLFFQRTAPPELRPTELAAEASIGAVWGILHQAVAGGRARDLPHLAGTLTYLFLAPAIGPEPAREAIRVEQELAA